MPLSTLEINTVIKSRLEKLNFSQKVPHLLLFSGQKEKTRLVAIAFAILWQKIPFKPPIETFSHPDLHIRKPEGKLSLHSIKSIREMIQEMALKPFQAEKKVFIIESAERMLPSSANALLKSLEEPPQNTLIILLAEKDKLLPTICSRLQEIRFPPSKNEEREEAHSIVKELYEMLLQTQNTKNVKFSEISKMANHFQARFDEKKKQYEKELRQVNQELFKEKELPKTLKDALDQEIDGSITSYILHEQKKFIVGIYDFYRDLVVASHITQEEKKKLLCREQYYHALRQLAQKGTKSLDMVSEIIEKASLALERSSPFAHIIEELFVKLQFC